MKNYNFNKRFIFNGDELQYQRINQGLTQEQLAELLKVSRNTIISLESGKYQPSLDLYMKLCDLFPNHDLFILSINAIKYHGI
jgi:putative transcriptional regulator